MEPTADSLENCSPMVNDNAMAGLRQLLVVGLRHLEPSEGQSGGSNTDLNQSVACFTGGTHPSGFNH